MSRMEIKQSKLLQSNFREGVLVTNVVDDIDWKNKTFKGKETHNIN